ncbi:MAG TPA: hypothetical protein VMR34_02610 [Candidatus Saccharimonadales bacterium]|nr:hypothetical protein [Candidatus Saccharimonadales bacterium]
MENQTLINQKIKVVVVYGGDGEQVCLPKRMLYKNRTYNFTELGLRHPTSKGKRMIHVFDMSDGAADYRLEFDAEALTWMLVAISDSQDVRY